MAVNTEPVSNQSDHPLLTRRQRTLLNHTLVHSALLSRVAIMFIPLAWTFSTSLKSPGEVFIKQSLTNSPVPWGCESSNRYNFA
ncbi:MAG: hypothetical protein ACOYNY_20785 [Caldilineaceae bacterium]|jgi:ABC-type glycerol-3-phosphate transport system permease component